MKAILTQWIIEDTTKAQVLSISLQALTLAQVFLVGVVLKIQAFVHILGL